MHCRTEDKVNIPGRNTFGQVDDRPITLAKASVAGGEVRSSLVRDEPRFSTSGRFDIARAKHRQPDHVSAQVGAWNFFENVPFHIGGPPKADASRRV